MLNWKKQGKGRPLKIRENRTTIIQINAFVKIVSINGFKSWLWMIRLVSEQMCSIFSNPPKETPASTFQSPIFPSYLPILKLFKRISSFQYFLGRSCNCYQISHQNIQWSDTIEITFCYFYLWLLPGSFFVQYFRKIFAVIPGTIFY